MKILFQGDSITDVGRNTNNGSLNSIGQGYPCLIASRLGADEPETYEFVNRGISGNRIVDVSAGPSRRTCCRSPAAPTASGTSSGGKTASTRSGSTMFTRCS